MFIADNIVLFPFKSLLSVFREIHNAALQEMAGESEAIRNELSQLYLALETGNLSDAAFDIRERELLDRLDVVEARELVAEDSDDHEEDEDDDEAGDEDEEHDDETENRDEQSKPR